MPSKFFNPIKINFLFMFTCPYMKINHTYKLIYDMDYVKTILVITAYDLHHTLAHYIKRKYGYVIIITAFKQILLF